VKEMGFQLFKEKRGTTNIDNIINCYFNINNINRISRLQHLSSTCLNFRERATKLALVTNNVNVTVLNELIQNRDGILSLSDDSFS